MSARGFMPSQPALLTRMSMVLEGLLLSSFVLRLAASRISEGAVAERRSAQTALAEEPFLRA